MCIHTSAARARFKPTISVLELWKILQVLGCSTTVMPIYRYEDGRPNGLMMCFRRNWERERERETNSFKVRYVGLFLNNQSDALVIPILFCYKTLHVSGISSAHHQEFSTVHSALVSFMQVSDDRFQAKSVWNCSSILTLTGSETRRVL